MTSGVRSSPCLLLAAWLCCGFFTPAILHLSAAETLEPVPINTTATPAKNDSEEQPISKILPRAKKPSVFPAIPADPIFDIERKLRESGAVESPRVLPDIAQGETRSIKATEWRLPKEEPGPAPKPLALPAGAGEPEDARVIADAEEVELSPAPKPQVVSVTKLPVVSGSAILKALDSQPKVQRNDLPSVIAEPEAGRQVELADEFPAANSKMQIAPAIPIVRAPSVALASPEESTRIESGGLLDKDDLVVAPVISETAKKEPAIDAAALLSAEAVKADAAELKVPGDGDVDATKKSARAWSVKDEHSPAANSKGKNPAAAPAKDPDADFAKAMKENARLKAMAEDLVRKAKLQQDKVLEGQSGAAIRGEHERKVMSALLDTQRGTGAISVKIYDLKTKLFLCARVKLIDTTEATARAPLPDGFWCRGATPGINVVSGLVRAEISHGGRFYPSFVKGLQVKAGEITPLEIPMSRPAQLDFEARGWVLADLDLGLRKQPGESSVWFGPRPTVADMILAAKSEGVRVLGMSVPLGDEAALNDLRKTLDHPDPEVLLLPVFPGPRNLFNGAGCGLGVTNWDGLKADCSIPELPLREAFEGIRARGGLAVFKDIKGLRPASIDEEILPLYRRLKDSDYFVDQKSNQTQLFSAGELPFDTVTGAYDVFAFDGTDAMESVWFNLLNEGVPVRAIGAGGGSLEGGRIPYGQTFLQIDGAPTREKVLEAVQAGHSAISFGPAVFCKVFERDMGPGSVLPTDGRQMNLQVQAYSSLTAGTQLDKIEILRNGKVVHTQTAGEGESEIQDMRFPISETASAWYVVRVTERGRHDGVLSRSDKPRRAWTSPIYFRSAAFAPPAPSISRVHGIMRRGLTPTRGVVTALATGMPTQRVETGPDGAYTIQLPSGGTLIFEAQDCEPLVKRIFEHPRVQRSIGKLTASDDIPGRLAQRPVFGLLRLLLSDLEWDVTLSPSVTPPEPPKIPEP